MEPISLKCPNCGGELKFETTMEFGFCMYCGNKVMIPRAAPSQVVNIMSDSAKFFLFVYYKGEQTQHAIEDEVTITVKYRDSAASGDPNPLGLEIKTDGLTIPCKAKIAAETGTGKVQISGIGKSLNISKEQKVRMNINGIALGSNSSRLYYGDMVSIGNVILRVQPMPAD